MFAFGIKNVFLECILLFWNILLFFWNILRHSRYALTAAPPTPSRATAVVRCRRLRSASPRPAHAARRGAPQRGPLPQTRGAARPLRPDCRAARRFARAALPGPPRRPGSSGADSESGSHYLHLSSLNGCSAPKRPAVMVAGYPSRAEICARKSPMPAGWQAQARACRKKPPRQPERAYAEG